MVPCIADGPAALQARKSQLNAASIQQAHGAALSPLLRLTALGLHT